MAAPATARNSAQPAPIDADLLAGVILEVSNLSATRAFYEPIFRDAQGRWVEGRRQLGFHAGPQRIEFIERPRPRTFAGGGYHQAYRVRPNRLHRLVDELVKAGHEANWWREDRTEERTATAYFHDPSGNIVQLVSSDDQSLTLDHAAIEVHAHDYCEHVYVKTLGGTVTYYHGWRLEDEADAKRWGAGDDPCAPWTRRDNPGWYDLVGHTGPAGSVKVPRPTTQVFISFGPTAMGMISATRVRQELPEEIIKGTPRLVFRTQRSPAQAVASIASVLPIPFEHEGRSAYIRDPDGNFAELRCEG